MSISIELKQRLRLSLFSNKFSTHTSTHPGTNSSAYPDMIMKGDLRGSIHKGLLADCINTKFWPCLDKTTLLHNCFKISSRLLQQYFRLPCTAIRLNKDYFETSLSLLHNYHKTNSELLKVQVQDFFKTIQGLHFGQ